MSQVETTEIVRYQEGAAPKTQGTLKKLLESDGVQRALLDVAAKHVTPERLAKMVLLASSRQPKLLECTQGSLLKSAMTSAELGLDCSGTLGAAYLVPFYNSKTGHSECQFIVGYRGLIDLARRSGRITSIEAHVVYFQDKFEVSFGLAPRLIHEPYLGADRKSDKEQIRCVYGIATMSDRSTQVEVMTLAEIEAIRSRSKAGSSGPWVTDFAEMARKTVVRRLCKYLPLSPELEQAIASDQELDEIEVTPAPLPTTGKGGASFGFKAAKEEAQTAPPADEPPEPEQSADGIDWTDTVIALADEYAGQGISQRQVADALAGLQEHGLPVSESILRKQVEAIIKSRGSDGTDTRGKKASKESAR